MRFDRQGNMLLCDHLVGVDVLPPPFDTIKSTIKLTADSYDVALTKKNDFPVLQRRLSILAGRRGHVPRRQANKSLEHSIWYRGTDRCFNISVGRYRPPRSP